MEHSAVVPQSVASSKDDAELMAAWHRAKARNAAVAIPDLQKADFSIPAPAFVKVQPHTAFDPWTLELARAKSFNDEALPPDETGWDCPICKNRGRIYEVEREPDGSPHRVFRVCKCEETRRTIRRMQESGLKNIISDSLLQNFETPEPWQQTIKAAAIKYAKAPEGWFFLGGQSGCGKTHLCTGISREELLRGRRVVYMMWRDHAPRLKAAVNEPDYASLVDPYKKAEVLYIDDLFKTGQTAGKALPSAGDINLAYEIINYRYVSKLPTIISSEFLLQELVDIDEALAGRIAQMAGTNAFSINLDRGKNYRLKGMVEL